MRILDYCNEARFEGCSGAIHCTRLFLELPVASQNAQLGIKRDKVSHIVIDDCIVLIGRTILRSSGWHR